jgi:hypothetical protein
LFLYKLHKLFIRKNETLAPLSVLGMYIRRLASISGTFGTYIRFGGIYILYRGIYIRLEKI